MNPRQHTFLTPGSHHVSYVEWGDGANPEVLFCVHGLTRNSRDFDALAKVLSTRYRVICPDVVGRGKSDWLNDKSAYNYGTYIADMLALIESLSLKKLDWVGTSMGGLIGMTIAALHPGLIDKLVLNDIGPFVPAEALKRISKYVGKPPYFQDKAAAEAHMRVIFAPFGITDDGHWKHMVEHGVSECEGGKFRLSYDPAIAEVFAGKEMQDVNLWGLWEKITARTLVLRGATSDILLPETARQMTMEGPKATLVEFTGVGHAPALMDDGQIAIINSWLLGNE